MRPLKKILHVEDEDDIRLLTKIVLESIGGFEVESCSSGQVALEKVRNFEPDLLILDVMMPEMDGPMTLEALRESQESAEIPVIFMTAKAQEQELQRLLGLGAIDIITKPYDPQTLSAQIQTKWNKFCHAT
jgi:CheY-like chemotaxis protein